MPGRWQPSPTQPSITTGRSEGAIIGGGGPIVFSRGACGAIANVRVASLSADDSTLTVSDSTFTDNRAVGGAGGSADTVVGLGAGGGIASLFGAMTTVTGSTFDGNHAIGGTGGVCGNGGNGFGGGIYNDDRSILEVRSSTITDNQASSDAGGVGKAAASTSKPAGACASTSFTIAHLFGNNASTSDDDVLLAITQSGSERNPAS